MSIIVLRYVGNEWNEKADYVFVNLFDNDVEANKFCVDNTDMKTLPWTVARIIHEGGGDETYMSSLA